MTDPVRNLIFILGDQLDLNAPVFRDLDKDHDVIIMAEVAGEIHRYPNHKQRLVLFFSAMRHFRDQLQDQGFQIYYQQMRHCQHFSGLEKRRCTV